MDGCSFMGTKKKVTVCASESSSVSLPIQTDQGSLFHTTVGRALSVIFYGNSMIKINYGGFLSRL